MSLPMFDIALFFIMTIKLHFRLEARFWILIRNILVFVTVTLSQIIR